TSSARCWCASNRTALLANASATGSNACCGRKLRLRPTSWPRCTTSMLSATELKQLDESFSSQTTAQILRWAWERFGKRAAIGTSFQGAGLVMMHIAKLNHFDFPVFTLDTGL